MPHLNYNCIKMRAIHLTSKGCQNAFKIGFENNIPIKREKK